MEAFYIRVQRSQVDDVQYNSKKNTLKRERGKETHAVEVGIYSWKDPSCAEEMKEIVHFAEYINFTFTLIKVLNDCWDVFMSCCIQFACLKLQNYDLHSLLKTTIGKFGNRGNFKSPT